MPPCMPRCVVQIGGRGRGRRREGGWRELKEREFIGNQCPYQGVLGAVLEPLHARMMTLRLCLCMPVCASMSRQLMKSLSLARALSRRATECQRTGLRPTNCSRRGKSSVRPSLRRRLATGLDRVCRRQTPSPPHSTPERGRLPRRAFEKAQHYARRWTVCGSELPNCRCSCSLPRLLRPGLPDDGGCVDLCYVARSSLVVINPGHGLPTLHRPACGSSAHARL